MPAWTPGAPWPTTTPGGALAPAWGGYTKLFARAAIGAGNSFHLGSHPLDRLDAGNVLAGGVAAPGGDLWIDIACDILDLTVAMGASNPEGIFSNTEAATVEVTLADPTGKYDPLNPDSPFSYGGRSRLVPGTPIEVFAEVVDGTTGTVTTHWLFSGTADSWGEDWTTSPGNRQAKLIASDVTKQFARWDRPEQAAQGAGDTTAQRIARIVTFFGWPGTVIAPAGGSFATLQATTLATSAWELLNRTTDDELGYVHFTPRGELRWLNRATWSTVGPPAVTVGCGAGHDILIDAAPSTIDATLKNAVHATRAGGTNQTALSQSSIDRYGRYDYQRTDLGLADDTQVAKWASAVVQLYAYPTVRLDGITMIPAIAAQPWAAWNDILGIRSVTDIARVVWAPPDYPDRVIDTTNRVIGARHLITRNGWEVTWQLVGANPIGVSGALFHMGPHAQDRLDADNVFGFAA
jgi:hypothetical protein